MIESQASWIAISRTGIYWECTCGDRTLGIIEPTASNFTKQLEALKAHVERCECILFDSNGRYNDPEDDDGE